MINYQNPAEPKIDELITRTKVGRGTQEFIKTSTGKAIVERSIADYRKALNDLHNMVFQEWSGSSDEELKHYRSISNNLATPLKLLKWLDAIIADGDNAEKLAKYGEAEQ
jgi:hypothetical protein